MRPGAVLAMAALLASVPACSHDETGEVASRKNVTNQALDVQRTFVGPDSRIDDVAATSSGTVIALAAGDLLIASSTPPAASLDDIGTERIPLRTQSLASSTDGGLTWNPLRLPAPRGITPIALDAIARGDTILLAGTLQRDDAVTASPATPVMFLRVTPAER